MFNSLINGMQQLLLVATQPSIPMTGDTTDVGSAAGNVSDTITDTITDAVSSGVNGYSQIEQSGGGMNPILIVLMYVALFGGAWFLLLRPHKKREKKMKEAQSQIKAGDNVVTNAGLFGRVADVGTDCFVVELGISGRTVKIPVLKSEVVGVREPVLTPPPKEEAAE